MGRPPDADRARDTNILVRVHVEQRERWQRAAKRAGMTLSEWLRALADAAAKRMEKR